MPGEEKAINVKMSLSGKSGSQHQQIFVATDDPAIPQMQLQLVGEVQPLIECAPRAITASRAATSDIEEYINVFSNLPDTEFRVINASTSNPFITIGKFVKRENGWLIPLRIRPGTKTLLPSEVRIFTDSIATREVVVEVKH